jgi:hypothetical protein
VAERPIALPPLQERERVVANSHLDVLIAEINEHLRRFHESRCDLRETIAMTRKSIDESRALMTEVDAIIAKR